MAWGCLWEEGQLGRSLQPELITAPPYSEPGWVQMDNGLAHLFQLCWSMTLRFPLAVLRQLILFSDGGDTADLVQQMTSFYTVSGVAPRVTVADDEVLVELDVERIAGREKLYREALADCTKGRFEEAKLKLLRLIEEDPTHSEYHRLLGQVWSELGDANEAIDHLIDALRWDPKNTYALTMMGNIWARDKDDMETALRYYRSALEKDPYDHVALNNIATQYLIKRDWSNAREWFDKALAVEPTYPNALHGIAVVCLQLGDMRRAFDAAIACLKNNPKKDELYHRTLTLAMDTGLNLISRPDGQSLVDKEAGLLGDLTGTPIRIEADQNIPTKAKIEYAEVYDRQEHLVKYRPDSPAVEHLQLHELYHLRFATKARAEGTNELFVVKSSHKEAFMRTMTPAGVKLRKEGFTEESILQYLTMIFEGLNRQVFNAPIDLFIEWEMYHDHPDFRPFQFMSLAALVQEAVQATTDKRIVGHSPADVLSKSKVYSLTLALLWKELYGVDRMLDFKPTPLEMRMAEQFYDEFKEYRDDRQPAEEYEVLQHWADDLKLSSYFTLVKETDHRRQQRSSGASILQGVLDKIEADPLDQQADDPVREEEMRTFMEARSKDGLDSAVVMFMVDALGTLGALPKTNVKEIAFEIAMLGTQGIEPGKQGYKLHHLPSKTFSGKHLLAYYYVSWKLAVPEMLSQLNLPYDEEFALAEQFVKGRQ